MIINISGTIEIDTKLAFTDNIMNFLNAQMDRLGIPEERRDAFTENMFDFSRQVRNIESDDNPRAAAKTSSAKGVYQFTDDSVDTGRNRMRTLGYNERPDWNPFTEEFIRSIKDNPQEWSDEQADAMFLANMFSQTGSDRFMKGIGAGSLQDRKDAYYKFHHTNPDDATRSRVDDIMLIDEVLDDKTRFF